MEERTGKFLMKRSLERSFLAIYCISTKITLDSDRYYSEPRKLYTFFGCTLEGKKKYLSCVLESEVEKTSEWYNFFQELKKRGVEHCVFALLPNNKELRDAVKLAFPKVEMFMSCDGVIEKLMKYNSYRTKDEIYRQVRGLYVAKDDVEYELNYKDFVERYKAYPFILNFTVKRGKKVC